MKILIADVEKMWRDLYKKCLSDVSERSRIPLSIDETTDGRALIEKANSGSYSMIITGYALNSVSGEQAISELRQQGNNIPIYLVSSLVGLRKFDVDATCINKGNITRKRLSEMVSENYRGK